MITLPWYVRRMMDEPPGEDRSGQTHALVASCVESGLSDAAVHDVLRRHQPSEDKYGPRLTTEVERLLTKHRRSHQHAGASCADAGCPSAPAWMTTAKHSAVGQLDRPGAGQPSRASASPSAGGWAPVDLTPYLDGSYQPPTPSLLTRSDGPALLYPGRVHWLSGEPESLKSWLALLACAQVLRQGQRVVFLDLEDGAGGITSRLLLMGVPAPDIEERFVYLSPERAFGPADHEALEPVIEAAALFVIDAATESLSLQGLNDKDGVDVAKWLELLPRWAKKLGPAVLVLDHVVKDVESRGRWATGSGHKLAGLDGVAYQLEAVDPAGIGLTGRSRLYEVKDRHGQVRPHVVHTSRGKRWAGDLVVESLRGGSAVDVRVDPPETTPRSFLPTAVMSRISDVLALAGRPLSGREVEDRVKLRAQVVRQALAALVDAGNVEVARGSHNSKQHRLVRSYPDEQPVT